MSGLRTIERNGRTFFVRPHYAGWVSVGEAIDGKLAWNHGIDEAEARRWIWKKLGSAGKPIAKEDLLPVNP